MFLSVSSRATTFSSTRRLSSWWSAQHLRYPTFEKMDQQKYFKHIQEVTLKSYWSHLTSKLLFCCAIFTPTFFQWTLSPSSFQFAGKSLSPACSLTVDPITLLSPLPCHSRATPVTSQCHSSWRFFCISFHCCLESTAFVRRISGMAPRKFLLYLKHCSVAKAFNAQIVKNLGVSMCCPFELLLIVVTCESTWHIWHMGSCSQAVW